MGLWNAAGVLNEDSPNVLHQQIDAWRQQIAELEAEREALKQQLGVSPDQEDEDSDTELLLDPVEVIPPKHGSAFVRGFRRFMHYVNSKILPVLKSFFESSTGFLWAALAIVALLSLTVVSTAAIIGVTVACVTTGLLTTIINYRQEQKLLYRQNLLAELKNDVGSLRSEIRELQSGVRELDLVKENAQLREDLAAASGSDTESELGLPSPLSSSDLPLSSSDLKVEIVEMSYANNLLASSEASPDDVSSSFVPNW